MADKIVFHNFHEGVITFPPSYRWRRDAIVADYTDPLLLKSMAYTTTITGEGGMSAVRTPSFTDRILTHSLPGRETELKWMNYSMVDGVSLSDHRPVTAILDMQVGVGVGGGRHAWHRRVIVI